MNKNTYLDSLYQELQKYDCDSVVKHVTEYDYIISDMLEDDNFDAVIEKLGTANELAASIAEEFAYELKKANQFDEPILGSKREYTDPETRNKTLITVINIFFVIGSIIYFISVATTVFGLLLAAMVLPIISVATAVFLVLATLSSAVFALAIFMLALNLKRKLILNLSSNNVSEVM
ncbi:hypothetical protein RZE82_05335 [Mollicutes bacterium LVI A0039]|nr:hypothetical protein RZE82_05335 [Mollicutes bacterium LVI A0039]